MTFDEIYRQHYTTLVKKARKMIPNADSHEALQLVSDVFLDLDADLKRGVTIDHIRGYLFRKLRGKSVDWFRRTFSRGHEEPREEQFEEPPQYFVYAQGSQKRPHTHKEYLVDKTLAPDELVMLREQLSLALGRLPAIEREAVLLHHVQGNTYRECAALQGVPVSTFEKRMIAALRKLRHTLSPSCSTCLSPPKGTIPCSEPNLSMTSPSSQMTITN